MMIIIHDVPLNYQSVSKLDFQWQGSVLKADCQRHLNIPFHSALNNLIRFILRRRSEYNVHSQVMVYRLSHRLVTHYRHHLRSHFSHFTARHTRSSYDFDSQLTYNSSCQSCIIDLCSHKSTQTSFEAYQRRHTCIRVLIISLNHTMHFTKI
jgi:hypothetical protein